MPDSNPKILSKTLQARKDLEMLAHSLKCLRRAPAAAATMKDR